MKHHPFVFILALTFILLAHPALAGKRVALVIGNGAYKHASPLMNPANDAKDMAKVLRGLGFEVIEKVVIGQRQMAEAVNDFGRKLQGCEIGVFYYAGHGMQIRGANYLIPVDANPESEGDVKYMAEDAGRVLTKMDEAGNRLNLVILDACRDNSFARSFRSGEKGLAQMDATAARYNVLGFRLLRTN